MDLHKASYVNRLAKKFAPLLSRCICSRLGYQPARAIDAYLNFLMGKGSGTGWDLAKEIEIAVSFVKRENPVLFDLGANVGEWSKGVLGALPRARLFLFEPSPECQNRIRSLKLPNSILIPSAVGDRAGKAKLHFSSAVDGSASLHGREDSYFRNREYRTIEVEVVTIDEVMQTHSLEFVDFMKMDIEGHELPALHGAAQALKNRRIGALSFEFGSGDINSKTFFRDFWNLLTPHKFKLRRITPGGSLVAVEDYYEDCEYFRGASNYIAALEDYFR